MQNIRHWMNRLFLISVLLLALGTFLGIGVASAHSSVVTDQVDVLQPLINCPTTAQTQDQSIYATYNSIVGTVLFRVGWESPTASGGYGYCHVKAEHPEALDKIAYILQYGRVVASSSTSVTIRGTYADGNQYQIYIVTSNNGMNDGRMRGIVTAYLYTG